MGVLLELSGESGLALDRDSVSDAEFELWEHMEDWSDVSATPLDSYHMHHQKVSPSEETDDCSHQNLDGAQSWAQDFPLSDPESWQDSPTGLVLQRSTTPIIDELEALGRIRYR